MSYKRIFSTRYCDKDVLANATDTIVIHKAHTQLSPGGTDWVAEGPGDQADEIDRIVRLFNDNSL